MVCSGALLLLALWSFWVGEASPTTKVVDETLAPPVFSQTSGRYENDFELQLTTNDPEAEIYYTCDGAVPSASSDKYEDPFTISHKKCGASPLMNVSTSPRWKSPLQPFGKINVVRAVTYKNGKYSDETTHVYVSSIATRTLPVVSLVFDENDFFSDKKGIYVIGMGQFDVSANFNKPWWFYPANYHQRGAAWERTAQLQYIAADATMQTEVGVRINGNATRAFPQKSLRLYARNGNLMQGPNKQHYSRMLLRNSGNDWDKTMFRDALIHAIVKGSEVETQDYQPVVVYFNGEYWGIHNLRERMDANYFSDKYNYNKNKLAILENSGDVNHGKARDGEDFRNLMGFVANNNLSDSRAYQRVKDAIDLQSFADYIAIETFFCNSDWPNNNVKFWRSNPNGQWRWIINDMDYSFGYNPGSEDIDLFQRLKTSPSATGKLFTALMKNTEFKQLFTSRLTQLLNGTLSSTTLLQHIEQARSSLLEEMPFHIDRWRKIGSIEAWEANIEAMRMFAQQRGAKVEQHLQQYLEQYQ